MRFAALQGNNANEYAAAGKKVANEAAKSFAITRKYGPDYGKIAEVGMATRSKEKIASMQAAAQVTKVGINAVADVKKTHLDETAREQVRNAKSSRKAGGLAALGSVAAAGFLMSRDNDKEDVPTNTDEKRAAIMAARKERDALNTEHEANYSEFKPKSIKEILASTPKPDESSKPDTSSPEVGAPAGKVAPGASSSLSGNQKTVADAVAKYESGDWGYEAFNQGGAAGGTKVLGKSGSHKQHFGRSLTDLTLSEIYKRQNTKEQGMSMQQHLDSGGLHAVGRYQFIGSTLQDEARRMGLDPKTTKFTPQVQDNIFLSHVKRVGNLSPWVGPSNNYSSSQKAQYNNMITGF